MLTNLKRNVAGNSKVVKMVHGREFFLNPSSFYFVNPEKLRKTCDKGLVTSIPVCVSF